jgi:MFS superfamily sulfate permease-like transporter
MTIWWLYLILGLLAAVGVAFVWLILKLNSGPAALRKGSKDPNSSLENAVEDDVEHIFNEDFREELRNRGRLHFEKIIGENAMFLQQDLRLTTSQLNEYMKTEITRKLQDEFAKYEESIMDAKNLAIASIQKTNAAIDEQRALLGQQVQKEIVAEKQQLVKRFEQNMTDIINHYVLAAIGNQIDLNDQLEYILADLAENKQAMIEDINNGA